MSTALRYEYMDPMIDEELLCIVCRKPFLDPISTPCQHAFCRQCFTNSVAVESVCPDCKQPLLARDILPVPLFARRMVDNLIVRCIPCGQTGIKRVQFEQHIDEVCPKTLVNCSAADVRCPWKGRARELNVHQASCPYEHLREVLTKLVAENNELRKNTALPKAMKTSDDLAQLKHEVTLLQAAVFHRKPYLEEFLDTHTVGSSIDLRQQELTNQDMAIIVRKAIIGKQCTALELQSNKFTDDGVSLLALGLRGNCTLTKLNIGHNTITDVSVRLLAQLLSTNTTRVEKLHLNGIRMTDRGASYLAEMLRQNTTLTSLGVSSNQLTDRGMQELFDALATGNRTLKNFYFISSNSITDACVDSLVAMLERNGTLRLMDMKESRLTAPSKQRIRQVANAKPNFAVAI